VILNCATEEIIESISAFALNARRVLEAMPHTSKYRLEASRWQTHPTAGHPVVHDFRDALNRIVTGKIVLVWQRVVA